MQSYEIVKALISLLCCDLSGVESLSDYLMGEGHSGDVMMRQQYLLMVDLQVQQELLDEGCVFDWAVGSVALYNLWTHGYDSVSFEALVTISEYLQYLIRGWDEYMGENCNAPCRMRCAKSILDYDLKVLLCNRLYGGRSLAEQIQDIFYGYGLESVLKNSALIMTGVSEVDRENPSQAIVDYEVFRAMRSCSAEHVEVD